MRTLEVPEPHSQQLEQSAATILGPLPNQWTTEIGTGWALLDFVAGHCLGGRGAARGPRSECSIILHSLSLKGRDSLLQSTLESETEELDIITTNTVSHRARLPETTMRSLAPAYVAVAAVAGLASAQSFFNTCDPTVSLPV